MSVDAGVINVSGSEVYVVNNKATGRPHREKKGNRLAEAETCSSFCGGAPERET